MHKQFRKKAIELRKEGKTYKEICESLDIEIPKSTLSVWCKNIPLPLGYERKIKEYNQFTLKKARKAALIAIKRKREIQVKEIWDQNGHFGELIKNKEIAKALLAILYLGEGSKSIQRGHLTFGNADPLVINSFLHLLRSCYAVDETKFRCTLQCRADNDIEQLEKFWASITKIPREQFYKARIDPRTIGKISQKQGYEGVCRIDYFSSRILLELLEMPKIIFMGL